MLREDGLAVAQVFADACINISNTRLWHANKKWKCCPLSSDKYTTVL